MNGNNLLMDVKIYPSGNKSSVKKPAKLPKVSDLKYR